MQNNPPCTGIVKLYVTTRAGLVSNRFINKLGRSAHVQNIQTKKRENMAYSKEDLRDAVEELKSGTGASMRSIAQKYRIPRSTLHDHVSGKYEQVGKGGPTVLTST